MNPVQRLIVSANAAAPLPVGDVAVPPSADAVGRRTWLHLAKGRLDTIFGALFATVVGGVVTLATTILLNHLLGPVGRGEHARLVVPIQTFGPLLCLGFANSVLLCFDKESRTIPVSLLRMGGLTLFVAFLGTLALAYFRPAFGPSELSGVILTMVTALLAAWTYIAMLTIQATGSTARFNLLRAAGPAISFVAMLLLMSADLLTPASAVASLAVASIVCIGFSWYWIKRDKLRFVAGAWKSKFHRFSWWYLLTDTVSTLSAQVDKIVCATFLPTRDLGIYAATYALSRFVTPAFQAIGSYVLVKGRGGDSTHQRQVVKHGTLAALGISAIAVITAVAGGSFAIKMFLGRGFEEVGVIFLILTAESCISGIALILLQNESLAGRPESVMLRQTVAFIVAGMAALYLIPRWGLLGAAYTTLLAGVLRAIMSGYLMVRTTAPSRT